MIGANEKRCRILFPFILFVFLNLPVWANLYGLTDLSSTSSSGLTQPQPGCGFTEKLDFHKASTFLPSVSETWIERQILHSIPGI